MNMERSVAIKKLGNILGKKMAWRINAKAPTPDERQAAREALTAASAERKRLVDEREARRAAILAADPEYQRLIIEARAACDQVEKLAGITRHFKITVGTTEGMFFVVKAEGDSWEEILAKLSPKKQAA